MKSKIIGCAKCRKEYRVLLDAHTYFKCYDCDTIIENNSTALQRANFSTVTTQTASTLTIKKQTRQVKQSSFDIGKFATCCFVGTFGVICLSVLLCAVGSLETIFHHSTPTVSVQPVISQSDNTKPTILAVTKTIPNTFTSDQSNKPACVIEQSVITFDANFEPLAKLVLKNESGKLITQVVLKFDFSDMSQWSNTSVSRSLAEQSISYMNLNVRIAPGQTASGNLKISLPQSKITDKPNITIIRVRYDDGSISD